MRLMPCRQLGCKSYTRNKNRYCDQHQQVHSGKRAYDPVAKRFYDSAAWRHISKLKLAETPLCELCSTDTRPVSARLVHHKDGDTSNNEATNLQSLCHDCHEVTHGRKKEVVTS